MSTRSGTTTNPSGFYRVHQLVTATLEDPDCAEAGELRDWLTSGGPEVRAMYAAYIAETEALRSAGVAEAEHERLVSLPDSVSAGRDTRYGTVLGVASALAVAALVLIAASLDWTANVEPPTDTLAGTAATDADTIATLTRLIAVEWQPGAAVADEMSRIAPGQRLQISSGQIEIVFDTGVELVVAGQADAEIDSDMRVIGRLGAYSARVSERGKGFIIDTPTTRVVDLGTEFGVVIADTGDTEVAVFEGMVDLDTLPDHPRLALPERLSQGEAVHIDKLGNQTRLMAITSERFPTPGRRQGANSYTAPLIAGVHDNLSDPSNKKFYRLVRSGLYEDVSAFVDRSYEWNGVDEGGIPDFLVGAEYLMPFNDDKVKTGFELSVSLSAPSRIYVFYSNKMPTPAWLTDDFEDTGRDIGLDRQGRSPASSKRLAIGAGKSIDETFSIWTRDALSAGDVVMGNAAQPLEGEKGWNMYGVAVTPLPPTQITRVR